MVGLSQVTELTEGMTDPEHSSEPAFDISDEYRPEPPAPARPPAWYDGSVRIGIHTSIAGDIVESLEIARKLGCNALQIFSWSPRMWPRAGSIRIPEADATRFRERRGQLGLGPLVIHSNYLINLASREPVLRVRSIQAFRDELVRAVALGADFLVAHPGASRGATIEQAIQEIVRGLRQAARGIKLDGLRILIENTSGMGTSLGSRLEEIAAILEAAPELPLGACLDTAHMFEAGYDIRSEAGLERTLEIIERTVGLRRVFVLHVNDSKTPLGSRVDRHAHIGKGKIGLEAFRRILNHPLLASSGSYGLEGRAFILETPIDAPGDDRRNVRTLWKLVGRSAQQAPRAEDGFSMLRAGKAGSRRRPASRNPTAKRLRSSRAKKSKREGRGSK